METLWQQQYGGYVFYISNSTVVDWTCLFFIIIYVFIFIIYLFIWGNFYIYAAVFIVLPALELR